MIIACIDFGKIVRFTLLRDDTVIQFATLDYDNDLLSKLYSFMQGIQIDSLRCCMPAYFSQNLLNNSVSLDHVQLATTNGFFCVSIEDLQAIKHLAKALNVQDVSITEHRFFCAEDKLYVFSFDNLYEIFTVVNGSLAELDIVSESQLESVIQQRCAKYGIREYQNLAYGPDIPYLISVFDNVFSVSDDDILSDLTFIANMLGARMFPIDTYLHSKYSLQSIIGDGESVPVTPVTPVTSIPEMPVIPAREDYTAPVEEQTNDDFEIPNHKKKSRSVEDAGDVPKKKKSSFVPVLAVFVIAMIGLNAGVYALNRSAGLQYQSLYSQYTEINNELTELQSKYNLIASQSSIDTSDNVYDFLKKAKLLKNKKVRLVGFVLEGSTVEVSVSANTEDDFWDYYDTISTKYNISNVTEGNPDGKRKVFVINLLL